MSNVVDLAQKRPSKAASVFPPILGQKDSDAQALPGKRRSVGGLLWASTKAVLMTLGALVVLGFLVGG